MAEHHLPPEPADHHHRGGRKGVHADDLKPGRRYTYYYGSGGGGGGGGGARTLCFAVLVLLLAAGITWLVLYVVYRPSHPTLAVTSAAVLALYNATAAAAAAGPTAVAAAFQVALVLRNPSARSAARYDRLAAYAAYRGEALTAPAPLPPLAQDPGAAVEVAPVLGGGGGGVASAAVPVPVSPETAAALAADVAYGVLPLRVVVLGRVRFVSGPFHRGWHSMYARCDLLLGVREAAGKSGAGCLPRQAPLLADPACNVDM